VECRAEQNGKCAGFFDNFPSQDAGKLAERAPAKVIEQLLCSADVQPGQVYSVDPIEKRVIERLLSEVEIWICVDVAAGIANNDSKGFFLDRRTHKPGER
jgi:hypothetical protein